MRYAIMLMLIAAPAFAGEPTVTLTQGELNAIADSAFAHGSAQRADMAAKGALDKVTSAFAPKPEPATEHAPSPVQTK